MARRMDDQRLTVHPSLPFHDSHPKASKTSRRHVYVFARSQKKRPNGVDCAVPRRFFVPSRHFICDYALFPLSALTRSPVIDLGTIDLIRKVEIDVINHEIESIVESKVCHGGLGRHGACLVLRCLLKELFFFFLILSFRLRFGTAAHANLTIS